MLRALTALAIVASVTAVTAVAGAQDPAEGEAAPECRVSVPKLSRPPGEGAKIPGNGHLWAGIQPDGRIVARPREHGGHPKQLRDGSIRDKILFFGRRSSRKRNLTITGRRIDADARRIRIDRGRGSWNGQALYWPGYVTFPTPGCWKVAATIGKGTRLVMVLSVEPPPETRR